MPHSWQPYRHEWAIDRQIDRLFRRTPSPTPPRRTHPTTMQPYGNPHSGVAAFTLHDTAIDIEFRDGKRYRYDAANPGSEAVRIMQHLALAGHGLATFINQHVRDRFARRLPPRPRSRTRPATPPR